MRLRIVVASVFALLLMFGGVCAIAVGEDSNNDKDTTTEIHVQNADIAAIIKVFSRKTGRNYILDERVKGKVSVFLPSKISSKNAVKILDSILALKGFTAVPIEENTWKIVPAKEAARTTVPIVEDDENLAGQASVVTQLIKLKYVNAEDVQKLTQQFVSTSGVVSAYGRTNSLIIVDYADNVARIKDIIRTIDIPSTGTDITIIPIKHTDARDIAETLKKILEDDETDSSSATSSRVESIRRAISSNRVSRASRLPISAQAEGAVIGVKTQKPKIIPDERTNSIILVADKTDTERIMALIERLDNPIDMATTRFYVYRCQHADAEELAEVIRGLLSGNGSSSDRSASLSDLTGFNRSSTSAGERSSARRTSLSRTRNRLRSNSRNVGESRLNRDEKGGVSAVLTDEVSITADPATNSLVILSSKSDYEKILELLKQLDVKRRQVLVEAALLEVGLTDSTQLGSEFNVSSGGKDGGILASANFGNLATLISNPAALENFAIAAASSGTLTLPGGIVIPSQAALLSAAQANSNVNILSAPNILTTDNEEAEIVVGQNVPFISSTATSETNLNNVFNQVERQDVGITLRLTPQISSGDFVKLRIFTEVSDLIDATASSTLGPTTTVRTSETTVITKSGQTIVIGGLLSEDVSSSDNGIPFLKDIPVFGNFFRLQSDDVRQTNLLIFITPTIIKDQFDARKASYEYKESLKEKIEQRGIKPNRKDLLDSERFDNVIEATIDDNANPSTITPPTRYMRNDIDRKRADDGVKDSDNHIREDGRIEKGTTDGVDRGYGSIQHKEGNAEPQEDESVIDLTLDPIFPEEHSTVDSKAVNKNAGNDTFHRASLGHIKGMNLKDSAIYVILKPIDSIDSKDENRLPFFYRKGAPVGVIIPGGAPISAKKFFKEGEIYLYEGDNIAVRMEAIGAFTKEGLRDVDDELAVSRGNWHILPPYEILHLGDGPWKKIK